MPRFFFHVDDGNSLPDTEGTELSDVREARSHAVTTSGELLRDFDGAFWQKGGPWMMHVTDEFNRLQFTLRFSADIPSGEVSFIPEPDGAGPPHARHAGHGDGAMAEE